MPGAVATVGAVHPVVTRVVVEPDDADPGVLVVGWELEGADTDVELAVGPTPEAIDHAHPTRVGAGTTTTRLRGRGADACYVSVAPAGSGSAVVAGVRRVPFEGVQNFRDLGGYRTVDGGRTRWGRVFRADSLHKLTVGDRELFERLGLRVVYDLRGDREREVNPTVADAVHLPVVGHVRSEGDDEATARAALLEASDGERVLAELYVGMLVHSAPLFGSLLRGLAAPDGLPAVFHCHAGKDRTGMVAALLLLAVGVSRADVLDDYELTRRYRTSDHQQDSLANLLRLGMAPEAAAGVLATPRWAMEQALDALEGEHGGIDAYLAGPVGLDADTLAQLRTATVERA
jgi:protein-tyrosine phosphatase